MKKFTDFPLLESKKKSYPLFYPYISKKSLKSIKTVLNSRWIGQGPLVDILEEKFKHQFAKTNHCQLVPYLKPNKSRQVDLKKRLHRKITVQSMN